MKISVKQKSPDLIGAYQGPAVSLVVPLLVVGVFVGLAVFIG
jgi:hypothetical protein